MSAPVRIAVVGAGRMGRVHLSVLEALPGVEVAAVVDPFAPGATHVDLDVLLAGGRPDGAVVAAPSTLHLELVAQLLEAGVPTLCEKPCGTTPAEARAAVERAAETGTPLQIGYWRRFVPELEELRGRIVAGELGAVLLVRSEQWDERPPAPSFRAVSGGILVDMGVHEFDQIRWLTGEELDCRAIAAATAGVDPPVEGDPESVEAVFALSGGGLGVVSLGRRFPPGDMCRVTVYGTSDSAECPFLWPPDSERAFAEGIAAQDAAFVGLVRGGTQQGASPADAVAALVAAEQAKSSLESRGEAS
ncbi:MAG TPA: Gfo/Idh/MocA family oxidoreductase [Gaiellaceae bacterium]